jgi:hypothetical protein
MNLGDAPDDIKITMLTGKNRLYRNSRYWVVKRTITEEGPYGQSGSALDPSSRPTRDPRLARPPAD